MGRVVPSRTRRTTDGLGLRRSTGGAALAAALFAFAAAPAAAQDFDLTMAILPSPNSLYAKMMAEVPDRVSRVTGGRVVVTLNDSLVGGTQITAAVRDGRVPMSGALHTYLAGDDPRMGVFNLPGLIDNIAEYAYLGEAFWFGDVERLWAEGWNSVVLAEGAWCNQALFSKEPIHTLEDFKGKRLRVHNPQTAALMEAIGAKPAPLPLSEVPPALERGVIDGVFTSTCYGNGQEYWRLAPNVQNWKIGPITGWVIIINKDIWEEIPEDLRTAIRTEMQALQHDALYDFYSSVNAAVANMKKEGIELWTAPQSEIDRVTAPELAQSSYDSFYARATELGFDGKEYVQRARDVLGK